VKRAARKPMQKKLQQKTEQPKKQITLQLFGPAVGRFENFKKKQNVDVDAVAARKLILDQLDIIESVAA
jgi:hypothetical protein